MEKGPWQWAGLRLHTLGVSLDEMLDLESATYAGTEETDGVACHRFNIVKDFWLLSVWLDPNRGWMPRRQELRKLDRDVAAVKRVKPWLMLRTEEFRQFRDPTSGAVIWFPSRGEATTSIEISAFELRDLTLNPPISPEQFRIDPSTLPDGVRVLDDGGRPTWYTGNRKDIYQEIEALIDAKDAEMKKLFDAAANPALAATARPGGDNSSGGFAWYWALGVVAVVLIVIGARKMLRKK
jgi:hypothetical protein